MISLLTISLITFVGFDLFWTFSERRDKFIPVSEMMESKNALAKEVRGVMETIHKRTSSIEGIWLYSWPDAVNLDLVHHVGQGDDPLPTGSFLEEDFEDVGKLGMDICTELNRKRTNTACTIFGAGDAWGLIIVIWKADATRPANHLEIVDSLANRITHLLYYKD